MMMTSRSDIKDRLIHNQSPFPTKDKVLTFTIPVDQTETLLFCSSSSSDSSGPSSNNGAKNGANPDNDPLNFIGPDDDPCTGRDSFFLDEGLGTSLDGVDEVTSPIFSSLGRNESVEEIVCWKGSSSDSSPRNDDSGGSISQKSLSLETTTFQIVPRNSVSSSSSSSSSSTAIVIGSSGSGIESQIISPSSPKYVNGENCKSFTLTIPESSGSTLKLYSSEEEQQPVPPPSKETTVKKSHTPRSKNMPLGRQGPQKCTICEKTFSNASALTKHKLTHSDERRHACATCGKAFKRQDHLNGHMLTHRNKKPFECQSKGCGKSYCDARSLRRHVENRHGHDVLESMNLNSSHKHGSKNKHQNSHHHKHQTNEKSHPQQEPQQELFVPIKLEYSDIDMESEGDKCSSEHGSITTSNIPTCEPVLEAKPQMNLEEKNDLEKHNACTTKPHQSYNGEINGTSSAAKNDNNTTRAAVVEKFVASPPTTAFIYPREGVPVMIKKENISVFDFDESVEEKESIAAAGLSFSGGGNACTLVSSTGTKISTSVGLTPPINALEKNIPASVAGPIVKVNGLLDSTSSAKLDNLADIKLIQEWAKKLGDSKVALLLSSSPTNGGGSSVNGTSSIAQITGPLQLGRHQAFAFDSSVGASGAMATSSHAFIPTSENGIFSVTPISIVPTSSKELNVKGADIFMTNDPTTDSPKPFYILPSQHLFPPTPTADSTPLNNSLSSSVQQQTKTKANEGGKIKPEPVKAKEKSNGIDAALANRIKTKLKAGNLKKSFKGNLENKPENGTIAKVSHGKRSGVSIPSSASVVNEAPALEERNEGVEQNQQQSTSAHGELMMISSEVSSNQNLMSSGSAFVPIVMSGTSNDPNAWCESPKEAMEEDRLSEGDGDDKPVECTICCRRFKNTPALNGHMRLHGGYFKKETEGSKKKETSKETNNGTPLQTVSVSVRALIEEKIRERRNNLLKQAAAAEAEKCAKEAAVASSPPLPDNQSTSKHTNNDKHKSDKNCLSKGNKFNDSKVPTAPTIAQQQLELTTQSNKPIFTNVKLNPELTSEKDKICDQIIFNNNFRNDNCKPTSITTSTTHISNDIPSIAIANINLETNFQDGCNADILINENLNGNNNLIGTAFTTSGVNPLDELILSQPPLLRDSMQPTSSSDLTFPFQVLDKSNFPFLDCSGISPNATGPTYHIIYVDSNGESIPIALDNGALGKVADLLAISATKSQTKIAGNLEEISTNGFKSIQEPSLECRPAPIQANVSDDPSSLLFEWRNSISSDNTDTSFGISQECHRSFLCSSSSEPGMESSKDPVAAGRGYCYTPILSPNSSFCLTPGPDSPFEVSSHNQSLSFICPSPTIGDGPAFQYSNISSIGNPPSSVEPIFSPDQSPQTAPQLSLPPSNLMGNVSLFNEEPQKMSMYQNAQAAPQHPNISNDLSYSNDFKKKSEQVQEISNVSGNSTKQSIEQQIPTKSNEEVIMDCLPPITSFNNIVNGATFSVNGKYENPLNSSSATSKVDSSQYPLVNGNSLMQPQPQQTFIPFEVFTLTPIRSKIADKWINGKFDKARKIHVGPCFQAEIPSLIDPPNKKSKRGRCVDERLWNPDVLNSCTAAELDNYLDFACCSAVPGGGMNKEYAFHLLMLSKGNIREAILRLMEKLPALPPKLKNYSYLENQRWTSEEIITFQIALFQMGKDFSKISKTVGTKCKEECLSFYYFWKKVCVTQYHVMKQIWKGRLEHQQLQMSQENCNNLIELISSSSSHHQIIGNFPSVC